MGIVDLRSDTITRPTEAMRRAMAEAEVGDDVFGEDPMVHALEERVAEILGKEAALFVPSGTMANVIALLVHCRPGNEVIIGEGAHCYFYEGGAGGAFAGVQFVQAGRGGIFTAAEFEAAIKPKAYYLAETKLVALENTHNRSGGRVFPQQDVVAIAERAGSHGIRVHLDGARIWNAAIATGLPLDALAAPVDSLSVCFSKGLGAPVGSAFVATRELVERGRRYRRMLGGAMRQSGIIAAGALYALERHRSRLNEDHLNAKRFAEGLCRIPGVAVDLSTVETNIVNFEVPDASRFVAQCAELEVRMLSTGPTTIRAVTHLEVSGADIDRAIEVSARVLRGSG